MIKTTVPIRGMHCKACEILTEESIAKVPGVHKVKVSLKNKSAEIFSRDNLDMEAVNEAVERAGYKTGMEDEKTWISRNPDDYKEAGAALAIFAVAYLALNALGIGNLNLAGKSAPADLAVVFMVGLTAGLSTCMALVGGLVLGIAARHAEKHPEATAFQKFKPHLFFNLGRIIFYVLLGGVIGAAGKIFQLTGMTLGSMTIIIGLVMLFLGIKLTELFPKFCSTSFSLPSGIGKFFGLKNRPEKQYSHINSMIAGGLTFFLPCGFTQAMQLYAMSTGSFVMGALIMGIFAAGTAPGLLGIGGLTSVIKGRFAKIFFKFAGLAVIAFAIFNISNGLNLTGWNFNFAPQKNIEQNGISEVTKTGESQTVKMEQGTNGYFPRKFEIKKGVPVRWVIDATDMNVCSSSISLPKFGVLKNLELGKNVIEFTPLETGTINFSCGMGMYPGSFTVVD